MSEAPHLIGETAAILNECWPKSSYEWTHTLINRTNYGQLPQTWAMYHTLSHKVIGSLSLLAWDQIPQTYQDSFKALPLESQINEYIWLDSLFVSPEYRGKDLHELAINTAVSDFLEASELNFKYLILHTMQYGKTFERMGFTAIQPADEYQKISSSILKGSSMVKVLLN